jgi:hypothetical protein
VTTNEFQPNAYTKAYQYKPAQGMIVTYEEGDPGWILEYERRRRTGNRIKEVSQIPKGKLLMIKTYEQEDVGLEFMR